jgi:hypothetical protein
MELYIPLFSKTTEFSININLKQYLSIATYANTVLHIRKSPAQYWNTEHPKYEQDTQFTYNITLRCICITIYAMEEQ